MCPSTFGNGETSPTRVDQKADDMDSSDRRLSEERHPTQVAEPMDTVVAVMNLPDRQVDSAAVRSRSDLTEVQANSHDSSLHDLTDSHAEDDNSRLDEINIPLPAHDWDDLVKRYQARMDEIGSEEADLMESFKNLTKFFALWTETSPSHEAMRSRKRLNTRIRFVEETEHDLQRKRQHYEQVVQAFASALQLLDG